MARRRRERMSEGKKNIIAGLIQEYNIKSAEDIQEALKDLLDGTIQEMMEAELDEHLGYDEYERSDNPDYGNGEVNEYDAALILQKSVRKIDSFPASCTWLFVPPSIEKTLLSSGNNSVSFTAILLGDVDGSFEGDAQ